MRLIGKARSLWDRLLGSAWVPLERAEARMGRPADQLPREYCRPHGLASLPGVALDGDGHAGHRRANFVGNVVARDLVPYRFDTEVSTQGGLHRGQHVVRGQGDAKTKKRRTRISESIDLALQHLGQRLEHR